MTKRVLAGMRPTNFLHVGNYFGAAKGMIELQNDPEYETFYMVADLHAITTPYNKDELEKATREVVLDYLAAGLDPEKSTIFIQSHVPQHTELAYLLSTAVTVARMQHLPTFKEKVKQYPQNVTMALLNYPVLMASDILLYKAEKVPVGIDQEPHLEVAREIARKMNEQYGIGFPEPTRYVTEGEYVPSLTGEGKMSKSVEGSYISLTDDLKTIKKKLAKVPTDSGRGEILFSDKSSQSETSVSDAVFKDAVTHEESKGLNSLYKLICLFMPEKAKLFVDAYSGDGVKYSEIKEGLADAIYNELKPIQDKRVEIAQDTVFINEILADGREKALSVAGETVAEIKKKIGLM